MYSTITKDEIIYKLEETDMNNSYEDVMGDIDKYMRSTIKDRSIDPPFLDESEMSGRGTQYGAMVDRLMNGEVGLDNVNVFTEGKFSGFMDTNPNDSTYSPFGTYGPSGNSNPNTHTVMRARLQEPLMGIEAMGSVPEPTWGDPQISFAKKKIDKWVKKMYNAWGDPSFESLNYGYPTGNMSRREEFKSTQLSEEMDENRRALAVGTQMRDQYGSITKPHIGLSWYNTPMLEYTQSLPLESAVQQRAVIPENDKKILGLYYSDALFSTQEREDIQRPSNMIYANGSSILDTEQLQQFPHEKQYMMSTNPYGYQKGLSVPQGDNTQSMGTENIALQYQGAVPFSDPISNKYHSLATIQSIDMKNQSNSVTAIPSDAQKAKYNIETKMNGENKYDNQRRMPNKSDGHRLKFMSENNTQGDNQEDRSRKMKYLTELQSQIYTSEVNDMGDSIGNITYTGAAPADISAIDRYQSADVNVDTLELNGVEPGTNLIIGDKSKASMYTDAEFTNDVYSVRSGKNTTLQPSLNSKLMDNTTIIATNEFGSTSIGGKGTGTRLYQRGTYNMKFDRDRDDLKELNI